jgi:hypothetical protein
MSKFDSDIIDREKKYTIPPEEIKRINDVDNILQYFNDKDIPDNIIKKINKLYPITKDFNFIRTEQLEIGMVIKAVSLDFKELLTTGILLQIKSNSSQKYGSLLLLNTANDSVWRIKPDKYYLFQIEKGIMKTLEIKKKLLEIKKSLKK